MCKRKWWLLLPVLAFAGLTAALLWVCLGPDSGFVIPDQILICLDPGHGGSDPGAVLGDRLEKDDNLKMALAVRDALERHGFENLSVMLTRKDDTDSMLAIREGLSRGYRAFTLYGALDGERLDMTVANYQALMFLAREGARGVLVGRRFLAAVVRNGSLEFPAGLDGTISVFCLGKDARGVTLKGLSYPLENAALTADFPLGVSNRFTGEPAEVTVKEGTLLILWER